MILAFKLFMLSRASGNVEVSRGVLMQHHNEFLEKYRDKIQSYIMKGAEIGWQHCDFLTDKTNHDDFIPQMSMDFNQLKKLYMKGQIFSSSHCLLVMYSVNSENDLSSIIEFGRQMISHVRLGLVLSADHSIDLVKATNYTNLPFLVSVHLDNGEEKFICPVLGEKEPRLEPDICEQTFNSYEGKLLKIGLVGIEPYMVPTNNGLDGTDVRLIDMLSKQMHFIPSIVIPSSFLAGEEMVCTEG